MPKTLDPLVVDGARTLRSADVVDLGVYVSVSADGISNGGSERWNDGADFGPDTPGTTTSGVNEALASGNPVQAWPGTFVVSTAITPTASGQRLRGSGTNYTVFQLAAGANCDLIDIPVAIVETEWSQFSLDGNKANQTAGTGAFVVGSSGTSGNNYRTKAYDLKIYDHYGVGIWANQANGSATGTSELILAHIAIKGVGGVGILDATADSHFSDIQIESSGSHGWYHTGTDVHAFNVHPFDVGGNGIQIGGGNSAHLHSCIADTTQNHGFVLAGSYSELVGCQAYNCGQAAAGSYNAYVFAGSYNELVGCVETDSTAHTFHAVNEASGDYNQVIGGYLANATGTLVVLTGTHSVATKVKGWNPRGFSVAQPAVPSTGGTVTNTTGVDVTVYIDASSSGGVTISINGQTVATPPASGDWSGWLHPGDQITLAYTNAPTWYWQGH